MKRSIAVLLLLWSIVLTAGQMPVSVAKNLSSLNLLYSLKKNTFIASSAFGQDLLKNVGGDKVIDTYMQGSLLFNAFYEKFSLLVFSSAYLYAQGDDISGRSVDSGFLDSMASLNIFVYGDKSSNLALSPFVVLPSGDSEKYRGEGHAKGGFYIWFDHQTVINYVLRFTTSFRRPFINESEEYGHEFLINFKMNKEIFPSVALLVGLSVATDSKKMFDKYHLASEVILGAMYKHENLNVEFSFLKGLGKAPFVPNYEFALSLSLIDLF